MDCYKCACSRRNRKTCNNLNQSEKNNNNSTVYCRVRYVSRPLCFGISDYSKVDSCKLHEYKFCGVKSMHIYFQISFC